MALLDPFDMGRAGHRVPMAQVAAHGEHQGELVAGWFGQAQGLLGDQLGPARGGGKAAIAIETGLAGARGAALGKGPLLGSVLGQEAMAEAAEIADPAGGEGAELLPHGCRRVETELADKAQPPAQLGKDLPVAAGFPGGLAKGGAEGDAPLRIGHHSGLFAPLGRRQQQVGHRRRFRAGVGLAEHHQGAVLGGGPHPIQPGQAHQRVGGRHPPEADLAPLHRLHLLPHRQPRLGRDRPGGQAPVALYFGPVRRVGDGAIAR